MWSPKAGKRRRAVLTALAAVGEPGMSLFALGVALDLPEPDLNNLLHRLTTKGQVRQLGKASTPAIGGGTRYQLDRIPRQRGDHAPGRHAVAVGEPQNQRLSVRPPPSQGGRRPGL